MNSETSENVKHFLSKFRDPESHRFHSVTASEFLECWNHYDTDLNGYLEGPELTNFFYELISSVIPDKIGEEIISQTAFEQLTTELMNAYDENGDGRIDINELIQILPTDETFLALFQNNAPLSSSVEFMRIWKQFDSGMNGFIENTQLREFLQHLLNNSHITVSESKLNEYTTIFIKLFDRDNDGKLQLCEMARLLRVKENYLIKPLFNPNAFGSINERSINHIFDKYDIDKNGFIEGDELLGFVKDFIEASGEELSEYKLQKIKQSILHEWDKNNDGKIGRDELMALLFQTIRIAEEKAASTKYSV